MFTTKNRIFWVGVDMVHPIFMPVAPYACIILPCCWFYSWSSVWYQ